MAIMKDGLKPEVITSFGRMQTNVWRLVEALTRMGPSLGGGAATSDLVMLLNAKFAAAGEKVWISQLTIYALKLCLNFNF